MKRLYILMALGGLVITSCSNAKDRIKDQDDTGKEEFTDSDSGSMMEALPVITFEEEFHDFGEIQEGQVAEHTFVFTNEGSGPLIISNASGSCGCTVPEWPRQPIAPGQKGQIKVSFNSSNRAGRQDKRVTLTTNAVPQTKVLNITSTVISQ
jgi:hypothetical protein